MISNLNQLQGMQQRRHGPDKNNIVILVNKEKYNAHLRIGIFQETHSSTNRSIIIIRTTCEIRSRKKPEMTVAKMSFYR